MLSNTANAGLRNHMITNDDFLKAFNNWWKVCKPDSVPDDVMFFDFLGCKPRWGAWPNSMNLDATGEARIRMLLSPHYHALVKAHYIKQASTEVPK